MSLRRARFPTTAALLLVGTLAVAQEPDTLTAAELRALAGHQVVERQWPVDDSPWPRIRLYRTIDATPLECAAVLADYEHQQDYIRNLDTARIIRRVDPVRTEVYSRYSGGTRFLPSASYTVLNEITRATDDSYAISWRLVSGSMIRSVQGSARFVPWMDSLHVRVITLLVYDQLVVPGFFGASFPPVRTRALDGVRGAVEAIGAEIERERISDRSRLDRQVAAVMAALARAPSR